MASLARSLLALAAVALLQVACAEPITLDQSGGLGEPGKSCSTFKFGRRSSRPDMRYDLDPVHLHEEINEVQIHDPNRNPTVIGTVLIGEDVTVCSEDGHPHVYQSTPLSFDFLRVTARHAKDSIDIVMHVTRYLEVPGPEPITN